ncbi:MAG: hypothetical protein AB7K24_22535 [Gemmataceae bacterium]
MKRRDFLALAMSSLAGCRAKIDPGPGNTSLAQFSANISAGDLLDPRTAGQRIGLYLDELAALGYRKQIRIILPPDWGPIIQQHWFPEIRRRGFKVLAILGQEKRDSAAMEDRAITWIKHIVPLVRGDLIGLQIVNEPPHTFTPAEYACYHRKIAPLIRQLAPEVPIVAGDFDVRARGSNTLGLWQEAVAAGAGDYDILSIHVTSKFRAGELTDFAQRLRAFASPGQRIWITEGDWGQLAFLRQNGVPIGECFIYTWNDDREDHLVRRPGGRLGG